MFRTLAITCVILMQAQELEAQDIQFTPFEIMAMREYSSQIPRIIGRCVDSLRIDTVYLENLKTGELDMYIQRYPLARYEFYLDEAIYRRVDIVQDDTRKDTTWTEDLETGEMMCVVQVIIKDIPNGAYHEFFPNGNIRIMGTLDGYNANGTLKKTGEWKEWDANGNVVRRETYP